MRTLGSSRLILRPLHASDEGFYSALYTSAEVMRHIAAPLSPEAARHAFQSSLIRNRESSGLDFSWIIARRALTDAIGLIGLRRLDASADVGGGEIGIMLAISAHGFGFASEAISQVAEHAFSDLGLTHAVLIHAAANTRMAAAAHRSGFAVAASAPGGHCRWELHRDP